MQFIDRPVAYLQRLHLNTEIFVNFNKDFAGCVTYIRYLCGASKVFFFFFFPICFRAQ